MLVIKVSRDENASLFVLLRILSVAYGDAINYTISVFTLDSYSRCIWVEGGECICTYIIELTRVRFAVIALDPLSITSIMRGRCLYKTAILIS